MIINGSHRFLQSNANAKRRKTKKRRPSATKKKKVIPNDYDENDESND